MTRLGLCLSPNDDRLGTPDTPAIRSTRAVDFVASLVRFRYGLPGCSPPCRIRLYGAAFTSMALIPARACEAEPTRFASRPTRSSRLGGASPISFSRVLFRQFFLKFSQRRWSAERPAIGPTRWRRLLAAVATS